MPTADELRELKGRDVRLRLRDGAEVEGSVVGTLDAADGLVVVLDRADRPGIRFTCNYQEIAAYTAL
jgi:hypothetical protein